MHLLEGCGSSEYKRKRTLANKKTGARDYCESTKYRRAAKAAEFATRELRSVNCRTDIFHPEPAAMDGCQTGRRLFRVVKQVELQVGKVSGIDISMAKPTVSVWLHKASGMNMSSNAKGCYFWGNMSSRPTGFARPAFPRIPPSGPSCLHTGTMPIHVSLQRQSTRRSASS